MKVLASIHFSNSFPITLAGSLNAILAETLSKKPNSVLSSSISPMIYRWQMTSHIKRRRKCTDSFRFNLPNFDALRSWRVGSPLLRHYDEVNVIKGSKISTLTKGRVFPGVRAIEKLTLLEFKKAIPTSLIRFRSNGRNGDELVPVYTNDNISSDAHFIPTPNGVSDYKDVQAVAMPNTFYEGLLLHGMDNLESLASLLNGAEEDSNGESTLAVAEAATSNANEEDT
uniref:Uncharacterized protein n=1 Tax=Glossina pallidipes TaxID=7398 RepID=A0A1B0A8F3_GLOPL